MLLTLDACICMLAVAVTSCESLINSHRVLYQQNLDTGLPFPASHGHRLWCIHDTGRTFLGRTAGLHAHKRTHRSISVCYNLKSATLFFLISLFKNSYPAGFVYVYTILHAVTDRGQAIVRIQAINIAIHIITMFIVLRLYRTSIRVCKRWEHHCSCVAHRSILSFYKPGPTMGLQLATYHTESTYPDNQVPMQRFNPNGSCLWYGTGLRASPYHPWLYPV